MARLLPNTGTFRSLANYNYRLWAGGAIVSNVGTWMQRVAQDWLVLTQLTHNNASAVGVVMSLQFGPQMLMLPLSGFAADFFDRRKLLMATQAAMGLCALGLGLLTVTGLVQLWHVYVFAFLHGCVAAFDAPARQVFVSDLVGETDLPNAVALNSTSFNAARMVGPALAGLLIAGVGTGWAFLANALSFGAVLCSLMFLRVGDLHPMRRAVRAPGGLVAGFRYVWNRPDLRAILLMLFLVGTFGMNFSIFISTMAVKVFHLGAGKYGLLSSIMAIGTVTGALLAAGRERPRIELLAVRRDARRHRRVGTHHHQLEQQPDATVDRAGHARPRDGDPPRHCARRHADRRADHRLDRRPVRSPLGDGRRRRGGTVRGDRHDPLPREVSAPAPACRRLAPALHHGRRRGVFSSEVRLF
jgi:MFS family permease